MNLLSREDSFPQAATLAGQSVLVVVKDRAWLVQKRKYFEDERHEGWMLPAIVMRNRRDFVASSVRPGDETLRT